MPLHSTSAKMILKQKEFGHQQTMRELMIGLGSHFSRRLYKPMLNSKGPAELCNLGQLYFGSVQFSVQSKLDVLLRRIFRYWSGKLIGASAITADY